MTYPGYWLDFFKIFFSSKWNKDQYKSTLEKEFINLVEVDYAICTSYGLHALSIALEFYNFNSKTQLLIPGYTSNVVSQCLEKLSIPYICVDIDPKTSTICPIDFGKKISKETKGVLVTHLFGNAVDNEIIRLARNFNLIVIEDCAHAHGAKTKNKMIGSLSDAAFFSFGYSKLINTYTGGILLTNDSELAKFARRDLAKRPTLMRIQVLRKFFTGHIEQVVAIPIFTFLLRPLLNSTFGMKKLRKFFRFITRRNIIQFYNYTNTQAFLGVQQMKLLQKNLDEKKAKAEFIINQTKLKFLEKKDGDVYYNLIAIVSNAKKYHNYLLTKGVDTGYGENIMDIIGNPSELPGSFFAHLHYLSIPNYQSLSEYQLLFIVKALNQAAIELN
jgi:dTDP-4-amino-4,6-dideoxygalactose transaminase